MAKISSRYLNQMHCHRIKTKDLPKLEDWIASPCEGFPKAWFFTNSFLTPKFKDEVLPFMDMKSSFHFAAGNYLEKFAEFIGYKKGEYRLDTNLGGTAVTGETILHTPHFMVSLGHDLTTHFHFGPCRLGRKYKINPSMPIPDDCLYRNMIIPQLTVLYRKVSGIDDFVGQENRWCDLAYLIKNAHRWYNLKR